VALSSKIYKARLNVADLDRHYYADHALTLARHPSETQERLMLRLLAFALNASDALSFGKGISNEEEPDLWSRSPSGEIDLWIDLGTPDPDRIRKACGRAKQVTLYCYGRRAVPAWWERHGKALARFDNLTARGIPADGCDGLAGMTAVSMDLQCTIEGGLAWISDAQRQVQIEPFNLKD
jgi:uncharacterized protein YaeQ